RFTVAAPVRFEEGVAPLLEPGSSLATATAIATATSPIAPSAPALVRSRAPTSARRRSRTRGTNLWAATAPELRPQALARLERGLERGAVAVDRAERLTETEAAVAVERGIGHVHPMRAHALGELDQLLLYLRPLGGGQVELREGLREVLRARATG